MTLKFIFLVSQKFVIYKILNTLKPFWFTIGSSVPLNEGVQFFFHDTCHFFFVISAHLYMKIILVDPNLVRTFFGNNMVRTLENNNFLVRTKLAYLRYDLYAIFY